MHKILGLLILICLVSCVKQEVGDYTLRFNRVLTIEAGSRTLITHVYGYNIPTSWDNFLVSNNLQNSDIEKVRIKNIVLTPLLGSPISYRFIDAIKVYISDPAKPSNKLPIGEAIPQPNERVSDLYLLPGIADIKDFLSLPNIRIECEIRYRDLITSTTEHNFQLDLDVFVK